MKNLSLKSLINNFSTELGFIYDTVTLHNCNSIQNAASEVMNTRDRIDIDDIKLESQTSQSFNHNITILKIWKTD